MGRDPAKEKGGLNLYGFCLNNSINRWDVLGMFPTDGIQADLKLLRDELDRLLDEEDNGYVARGTNQGRIDSIVKQVDALEAQLGQISQGADGNLPNTGTNGSNLEFISTYSTQRHTGYGPYGMVLEIYPVHQIAIDRALSQLSVDDRDILKRMQVEADKDQRPQFQYKHGMRDGRLKPDGTPFETADEARHRANNHVREQLTMAQKLLSEGKRPEALEHFGLALHTLQDATSPAHIGFQPWPPPGALWGAHGKAGHVLKENIYPGDDSLLFRTTQRAYDYLVGAVPLPDDFFDH